MRATEKTDAARQPFKPDPVRYLQRAYEQTLKATAAPNDWQGTTTATGAQLYFRRPGATTSQKSCPVPILLVTNLGDSQVMVIRPSTGDVIFKTKEQWHWFDCPRQLGTNSPDTPVENAVVDEVEIREGDIVLAMSDGVIDNLWEHEIVENVTTSLARWEKGERERPRRNSGAERACGASPGMQFVAEELMNAARVIALDSFAESPFMEHALEEGLASPGGEWLYIQWRGTLANTVTGKLDDISVVAALCRKNG